MSENADSDLGPVASSRVRVFLERQILPGRSVYLQARGKCARRIGAVKPVFLPLGRLDRHGRPKGRDAHISAAIARALQEPHLQLGRLHTRVDCCRMAQVIRTPVTSARDWRSFASKRIAPAASRLAVVD